MKLVWSPETAANAFVSTVKSDSSVAELVSAMAAGFKAKLIVETWSKGGAILTSIGLAVARQQAGGRHVCIVSDEETEREYMQLMKEYGGACEVKIGEPEEAMKDLLGIEFLVVDSNRSDFSRVLRVANLSQQGAVVVLKNADSVRLSSIGWRAVAEERSRLLVRSVFLPVGKGLDIAHVSSSATGASVAAGRGGRWIKHVDKVTGELILIRKH